MQAFTRRSLVLGAIAAPVSAYAQTCHAQTRYAQVWPTIRLVVPYPPAGSTDVIARLVQPELQRRLGTSVIVENRPGASGSIGTASVAKSPPDGSSWLFTGTIPCQASGQRGFAVRVLPKNADLANPFEPGLICWG